MYICQCYNFLMVGQFGTVGQMVIYISFILTFSAEDMTKAKHIEVVLLTLVPDLKQLL